MSRVPADATRNTGWRDHSWAKCYKTYQSLCWTIRCPAPRRFKNQQHIITGHPYHPVYGRCSIWYLGHRLWNGVGFDLDRFRIGCWLDCGMTQPWQASQLAQLPQSSWYHMIPWFMHESPIRTCASTFPGTVYNFTQGMLGNCSRALPASASFEDCSMTWLTCSHGQGFSICWGPHATIHVCAGFGGST